MLYVSDLPAWGVRLFAFAFGALWGSFFNVAIHRWPRDLSVVTPPSHCPHCKTAIPAWRNVPIFGYLWLKGRAACCGTRLTPRYVLVELISGCLCLALAQRFLIGAGETATLNAAGIETLLFFAFVGGLVIATFVDLEWMEIPDEVSIGGTAVGLATVTFRPAGPDVVDLALGAGGGFLVVQLLLVWSWERITGRRGMGEGDSKLLMFIGAFLGWKGALFALVGGALQGVVVSAVVLLSGRRLGPSIDAQGAPPQTAAETTSSDDQHEGTHAEEASVTQKASGEAEAPGGHEPEASEATPEPVQAKPELGATSLTLSDGTVVRRLEDGDLLRIDDRHGRALWEYLVEREDEATARRRIPFGPFLALAALEFLFFGEPLIEAYLGLFR